MSCCYWTLQGRRQYLFPSLRELWTFFSLKTVAGTTLLVKIIQTTPSPRWLIRQQYTAVDMQVGWDRMGRGEKNSCSPTRCLMEAANKTTPTADKPSQTTTYSKTQRLKKLICKREDRTVHDVDGMMLPTERPWIYTFSLCNAVQLPRQYTSYYEIHYFQLHNPKTAFISQPIASVLQCRKLVHVSYSLISTQEIYRLRLHFMFGKKY